MSMQPFRLEMDMNYEMIEQLNVKQKESDCWNAKYRNEEGELEERGE